MMIIKYRKKVKFEGYDDANWWKRLETYPEAVCIKRVTQGKQGNVMDLLILILEVLLGLSWVNFYECRSRDEGDLRASLMV